MKDVNHYSTLSSLLFKIHQALTLVIWKSRNGFNSPGTKEKLL